jgi:hypothetical protein
MRRVLLLAVLIVGCRCKREDAIPEKPVKKRTPAPLTEAMQACMDGVRAITERVDRCEGGHEWWGSIDRAIEQLRPGCEAMTAAPGALYEKKAVDACIAELKSLPCGARLPDSCRNFGTRKHGEPCAFSVQCVAGSYCKVDFDAMCGVCAPAGKLGDKCFDDPCEEDWVCIEKVCQRPGEVNDKCVTDSECKRTLFCDHTSTGSTCKKLHLEGETCLPHECAPSFVCEGGKCKRRPPPAPPGAKCGNGLDCLDFSCVEGTCRAPGEQGDACGKPDQPQCGSSYVCMKGKCTLPDARECH